MAAFIELIERTNGKNEIHLPRQTNENRRVNAQNAALGFSNSYKIASHSIRCVLNFKTN